MYIYDKAKTEISKRMIRYGQSLAIYSSGVNFATQMIHVHHCTLLLWLYNIIQACLCYLNKESMII